VRVLDLFSGIGGFSIAMHRAGLETVAFSEVEPFTSRVLAERFPGVPNLGDVTKVDEGEVHERFGRIDVVCGGFPCQDLSVAGRRAGLAGDRSGLFWEIVRLAGGLRPAWLVLENVPGLLSSNNGRDIRTVVSALDELGYGVAWRCLDAQHFGVPQRRNRLFLVCRLGAPCPPEILFEPEGLPGNPLAGRETRSPVAALTSNGVGTCGADDNQAQAGHLFACQGSNVGEFGTLRAGNGGLMGGVPFVQEEVAGGNPARYGKGTDSDCTDTLITAHETGQGWWNEDPIAGTLRAEGENRPSRPSHVIAHALTAEGFDASEDGTGRGTPLVPLGFHSTQDPITTQDGTPCLGTGNSEGYGSMAVAFALRGRKDGAQVEVSGDQTSAIRGAGGGSSKDYVAGGMAVRRLTPLECERLQGFPDHWTLIPGAKDSPRYRALGNAVAVPVVEWIAHRLRRAA
jgi:DNA (cytosine-5)-methyltransferase 1